MGVYTRYKRDPGGFRKLVELLETTPKSRRERMIDVGMEEDPEYTERALQYIMNFDDVLGMSDVELAEVIATAPPRMTAFAVCKLEENVKQRFLRCSKPKIATEIKDLLNANITMTEVGGAQLRLVQSAREAEKKGLVKTKRIPLQAA